MRSQRDRLIRRGCKIAGHYLLQARISFGRLGEYARGYVMFLIWIPRLVSSLIRGDFRKSEQSSDRQGYNFLGWSNVLKVFYINLEHRTDRHELVLEALSSIQVKAPQRIAGKLRSNGALGCALSHIEAIQALIDQNVGLGMICEDDIDFMGGVEELEILLDSFMNTPNLGVLCLANRIRGPFFPVNQELAVSNNIQMAACYVVKPHALSALHESFSNSARQLEAGVSVSSASIDQLWKQVQTSGPYFAVPRKKFAFQRESYSDIVGTVKDYN